MYAEHCPAISNGMQSDPEIFKRGCVFVILSIRQIIDRVPGQMDEVDELRSQAPCLFGWKRSAYQHIQLNGARLQKTLNATQDPAGAIRALLEVPGLGIVKAAFVAQLFGFDIACIDSRNAEREGRKQRAFEYDKSRPAGARLDRLLALYLSATHGRAQEYWDAWCAFVGPGYGMTAEECSALHLVILPDNFVPF